MNKPNGYVRRTNDPCDICLGKHKIANGNQKYGLYALFKKDDKWICLNCARKIKLL